MKQPRSRYGRKLVQTDFYEPPDTKRSFKDDMQHDAGLFDSEDYTFKAPYYERYHYDNYEDPVKMLGGALRAMSLSGGASMYSSSSDSDLSLHSSDSFESSFVSSDSNSGWSDGSYASKGDSASSFDASDDVSLVSEDSLS